ncbi:mechanosensitive ion channel family protein [Mastigocladopsis repens]|uniref:mechanosensitive ion channel family protein n=1 Tax=Mastigocladopsis repens TaxID=221287 RepID=UPI00031E8820|nr:mechanosensitive ion channel domain-containing protein [Mastigocladopsis repens]
MLDSLFEVLNSDGRLHIGALGLTWLLAFISGGLFLPILGLRSMSFAQSLITRFISLKERVAYQKVVKPYENWLGVAFCLLLADIFAILLPESDWSRLIEIPIGLALTITGSWLASQIFKQFFDFYLLDAAIKSGRKVNSELLLLTKLLANIIIVVVATIIFAETHQINIFGLVASLGIGGLAIAFAAQKILEQVLGGVVIYLDRPFVIDDYIGLPDGTFGRVESIGLRSTKIRTSGKGTLIIVPNSSLTQVNIENFTGAKKVMAITYLNFYRAVQNEERALIRQVILESTVDIFGIDTRSTDVIFRDLPEQVGQSSKVQTAERTQAQITFFILGSGEVSMGLRRQLLDLANQSITQRLKEYGIAFDIDEPTIYVDSPITI